MFPGGRVYFVNNAIYHGELDVEIDPFFITSGNSMQQQLLQLCMLVTTRVTPHCMKEGCMYMYVVIEIKHIGKDRKSLIF